MGYNQSMLKKIIVTLMILLFVALAAIGTLIWRAVVRTYDTSTPILVQATPHPAVSTSPTTIPQTTIPDITNPTNPDVGYGQSHVTVFDPSIITAFMDEIAGRINGNISIFYHNLEHGFIFGFNDEFEYHSASFNKASHALFLYQLAEAGKIDMNTTHTFTVHNRRGGTGVIRHNYRLGHQFTTAELLMYSVRESDNTAFRILVDYYERLFSYTDFIRDIGGNAGMVRNIFGRRYSASEAGFIMLHIHRYIESNGMYSLDFQNDLRLGYPIIATSHPSIHKYGWWAPYFHDMAIVYACSPYILVIMSDLARSASVGAHDVFYEISLFIQNFNTRYFGKNWY